MPKISQLDSESNPTSDDELPMVDQTSGTTKRVALSNLISLTGWVTAGETWTFSSWDSTNKTGVITVPTDATTKYSVGMRIRISQTTGGTKYGIITKVAATALTVYFGTDYTLNNETISSPVYSAHKAPFGFPTNPAKWTVSATATSARTISGTSYGSLTDTFTVPIGAWRLTLKVNFGKAATASTTNDLYWVTLSSDASTETNPSITAFCLWRFGSAGASSAGRITSSTEDYVDVSTATTFTTMGKIGSGSDAGAISADQQATVFKAICAHL